MDKMCPARYVTWIGAWAVLSASPVCNMDEGMDNKCPALYVTWLELDGVVQSKRAQSCMQGTWGLGSKWGDPKN